MSLVNSPDKHFLMDTDYYLPCSTLTVKEGGSLSPTPLGQNNGLNNCLPPTQESKWLTRFTSMKWCITWQTIIFPTIPYNYFSNGPLFCLQKWPGSNTWLLELLVLSNQQFLTQRDSVRCYPKERKAANHPLLWEVLALLLNEKKKIDA